MYPTMFGKKQSNTLDLINQLVEMVWFKINLFNSDLSRSLNEESVMFNDKVQNMTRFIQKSCYFWCTVRHDANKLHKVLSQSNNKKI